MDNRVMSSRLSARDWEEAFPGGNGRVGVLVMGEPQNEKIIVNHEKLFLPMEGRVQMPEMARYLPEVRRLICEGKFRDAAKLFLQKSVEQGMPGYGPDFFHPAFDINVATCPERSVEDRLRELYFSTGEIITSWKDGDQKIERRVFVSRPESAIVMVIRSTGNVLPDCSFWLSESGMDTAPEREALQAYVDRSETTVSESGLTFSCDYKKGGGYVGAARVIPQGGSMEATGDKLTVKGASEILVLANVAPELDLDSCQSRLDKLSTNYDELLDSHKRVHEELFSRVKLDLDASDEQRRLTNEELLSQAKKNGMPLSLAERMHDYGRYLLICSAGELPPNAQGLWNGTWAITNLVDYVTNIELEMATWPALPGALPECLDGYFDFIESFIPDWRENAKKLYGCRGVLASSRSSNHGQLHHFSEEYPHEFWTAGAGWMALTFYEHWVFSGDKDFFINRALPLMKETALFYEDFLIEDPDGHLQFIPSLLPENNPGNSDSQAARNAVMDIAVARELFTNLITSCEELGIERDTIPNWKALLMKLPPYKYNPDGSLKEWVDDDLHDNLPHRHVSHLYPAMPGFEAEDDKRLAEGCLKAIDRRLENGLMRRCGWSLGHSVNAAARLKDGALTQRFLSEIATYFVHPNLLTLLDSDGGRFQIDANLGFTAAVMEALVFSRKGELELLPALPPDWKKGIIEGVRCRGGVTVTRLEWNTSAGSLRVSFLSNASQTIKLKIRGKEVETVKLTDADKSFDFHLS